MSSCMENYVIEEIRRYMRLLQNIQNFGLPTSCRYTWLQKRADINLNVLTPQLKEDICKYVRKAGVAGCKDFLRDIKNFAVILHEKQKYSALPIEENLKTSNNFLEYAIQRLKYIAEDRSRSDDMMSTVIKGRRSLQRHWIQQYLYYNIFDVFSNIFNK